MSLYTETLIYPHEIIKNRIIDTDGVKVRLFVKKPNDHFYFFFDCDTVQISGRHERFSDRLLTKNETVTASAICVTACAAILSKEAAWQGLCWQQCPAPRFLRAVAGSD